MDLVIYNLAYCKEEYTMVEEEKQEEGEQITEESGDGDKPERSDLIEKANEAAERLEVATKKQEAILNDQKEFAVKSALSGKAEAGIAPTPKPEETDKEYAARVMRGDAGK